IEELVSAWADAWNHHDAEAAAALVTPEVDFVNVLGRWFKGKESSSNIIANFIPGKCETALGAISILKLVSSAKISRSHTCNGASQATRIGTDLLAAGDMAFSLGY